MTSRRLRFGPRMPIDPDVGEATDYEHFWGAKGMVQIVRRDRGYEVEIGTHVHEYGVLSFGCTAVAGTEDAALDIAEARMRELCPAAWEFYAPLVIDDDVATTTNDTTTTATTAEVTP